MAEIHVHHSPSGKEPDQGWGYSFENMAEARAVLQSSSSENACCAALDFLGTQKNCQAVAEIAWCLADTRPAVQSHAVRVLNSIEAIDHSSYDQLARGAGSAAAMLTLARRINRERTASQEHLAARFLKISVRHRDGMVREALAEIAFRQDPEGALSFFTSLAQPSGIKSAAVRPRTRENACAVIGRLTNVVTQRGFDAVRGQELRHTAISCLAAVAQQEIAQKRNDTRALACFHSLSPLAVQDSDSGLKSFDEVALRVFETGLVHGSRTVRDRAALALIQLTVLDYSREELDSQAFREARRNGEELPRRVDPGLAFQVSRALTPVLVRGTEESFLSVARVLEYAVSEKTARDTLRLMIGRLHAGSHLVRSAALTVIRKHGGFIDDATVYRLAETLRRIRSTATESRGDTDLKSERLHYHCLALTCAGRRAALATDVLGEIATDTALEFKVRESAIEALGETGNPAALGILLGLGSDPSPFIREHARFARQKITDSSRPDWLP